MINHIPNCIALWKPAGNITNPKVTPFADISKSIIVRIGILALPIIAISTPWTALSYLTCLSLYYRWEWSRSIRAADAIAIQEFKLSTPRSSVLKYIRDRNDPSLITHLQGNLTLKDNKDNDLWKTICTDDEEDNYSTCTTLADRLFGYTLSSDVKSQYFLEAIYNERLIIYLLETGKIKANELTEETQFECFLDLSYEPNPQKTIETLIKHGFNINAKNKNGLSPLHSLLYETPEELQIYKDIEILLKNGANAKENVTIDGEVKTTTCLCRTEPIRKLVQKYL